MTKTFDRRADARFTALLRGRLIAKSGRARDCTVLDISAAGAAVRCNLPGAAGAVTLNLEEIGRVPATVVQAAPGDVLRLAFTCDEAQRRAITATLMALLESGQARPVPRRRQDRIAMTNFHFLRAGGEKVPCDVLDISLQGISLRTAVRPPVGEFVVVAGRGGHVARHHDQGIAIRLDVGEAPAGERLPRVYQGPASGPSLLLDDRV